MDVTQGVLAPAKKNGFPRAGVPGGVLASTAFVLAAGFITVWSVGCRQTEDIPPAEVKVVEAYGMKLDESAAPQQVVYVLLRAMRDDFEAAQAFDRERQKAAIKTTFALAAYGAMEKHLLESVGQVAGEDKVSLGEERDHELYGIVKHWTPIVGHYVRSFDTDAQALMNRMELLTDPQKEVAQVFVPVAHDPQEKDPARQELATLDIELVKEKATGGSDAYWRVARVGFRGPGTRKPVIPATRPAVTPSAPA